MYVIDEDGNVLGIRQRVNYIQYAKDRDDFMKQLNEKYGPDPGNLRDK